MKFLKENAVLFVIALVNFFVIFFPNFLGYYGYSSDELYFIACSKRLAFGYIDHPPLCVFLLKCIRLLFGDSLPAIRLLPAMTHAVSILLVGIITQRLGGGKFAQVLSGLAFSIMPCYLIFNSRYSKIFIEPFLFLLALFILLVILQEDRKKYWVPFGVVIGLGLMNKFTFAVYALAILMGILLSPLKKHFREKYFWLGILAMVVIVSPLLLWQIHHHFISADFIRYRLTTYEVFTPPVFHIIGQIILFHPLVFPLCLIGFFSLFFSPRYKPYRIFSWIVLVPFLLFLFTWSRMDRVAPLYPLLVSSGAVTLEAVINQRGRHWLKPFLISLLGAAGLISFLLFLPILPPKVLVEYPRKIFAEHQELQSPLWVGLFFMYDHLFADRLGWESLVKDVAAVYHKLPAEDQEKAVIFATSYGEAGAIELLGQRYHLPPVVSLHNNYRLWGYGRAPWDVVIAIGADKEILNSFFEKVEDPGVIHACEECSFDEKRLPIYIGRKTKMPIKELWRIVNRNILPPINF
jgi:4-amino-4-deoxy-L-arabinose transferase-like glycosyltransferase